MEVKFLDDEVEMNKRAAQHSIYQWTTQQPVSILKKVKNYTIH